MVARGGEAISFFCCGAEQKKIQAEHPTRSVAEGRAQKLRIDIISEQISYLYVIYS